MNAIEESLFEKTKDFQEGQIYSDQWKFAKSYLPKVLDTISQVFPHYSLHNSTHSEAILNNVVRIIGVECIKKLTVVDLWLLLAAAYYHDCGMVVTGEDKIALFKEGSDFVKYIDDKQNNASSPMHQYAKLFVIKDKKVFYKDEQLTHESYEGARFLLADYIRNEHAERSGKRIETEQSLHFPGDPIPERIIRILKLICDCHTKDVREVMNLQPIESSGCGIEDCHPRFIAAMLRLGDLLDVDSNRVSEVLLATLGSIPSDSKFYNKTNRAITHIRIDQSIIEITAECDDYHVADLVNHWFKWLNDELVFYMKQWHKIIPFKDFGYLPTVGDLKVNLLSYDTFDGKKRPSFEIDTSRAIELLQGAGLYSDSCECIRELLQNAVDATYLRIYKENPGINSIADFKDKCSHYPLTVNLNRIPQTGDSTEVCWSVEIKDNGIGMTKDDLQYLSKTGSSEKNAEKKRLIHSVPETLWPSGTFGIGFQSVFLITDKVRIVTRKLNKDNYICAELYNPSGREKGAILIQSVSGDDQSCGTTLSFVFKENKADGQYIYYNQDSYSYSVSEYLSYDFAKNKQFNLLGMRVLDEVVRFAGGTFIPVEFYLEGKKKEYVSEKTKIDFGEIDNETGLQLCIDKNKAPRGGDFDIKVYFRNQAVRDYYRSLPFFTFHINILMGNAKDILSLNRDQIRREYSPALYENMKKTSIRFINNEIDSFDELGREYADMFLELFRDYAEEKGFAHIPERNYWEAFGVTLKKETTTKSETIPLGRLLTADYIELINRKRGLDDILFFNLSGVKYSTPVDYEHFYSIFLFILKMAKKKGYHVLLTKDGFRLCKSKCDVIEDTKEAREAVMNGYLKEESRARSLFPCSEKYAALRIDARLIPDFTSVDEDLYLPRMICPYIREYRIEFADSAIGLVYDFDEAVLSTAYKYRADKAVTKEQIKEAYELFKKEWDPIVKAVNRKAEKEPHEPYSFRRRGFLV